MMNPTATQEGKFSSPLISKEEENQARLAFQNSYGHDCLVDVRLTDLPDGYNDIELNNILREFTFFPLHVT